jgi:hypothetical protein
MNICSELGLSKDLARAMLIKNGWNEEAAKNEFLSDENYIKKEFGFSLEDGEKRFNEYKKNPTFTCFCCYDDVAIEDGVIFEECGHSLCGECFKEFLEEKFKNGPNCVFTSCSDHECGMIIPDEYW